MTDIILSAFEAAEQMTDAELEETISTLEGVVFESRLLFSGALLPVLKRAKENRKTGSGPGLYDGGTLTPEEVAELVQAYRQKSTPHPMAIAVLLSTILVVLGLYKLPYSFFMLLRIVLCITAAIGVKRARDTTHNNWVWVYAILAVLYNPVLPVRLGDKSSWVLLNGITVVIFWVGLFKFENIMGHLKKLASHSVIPRLMKIAVAILAVCVNGAVLFGVALLLVYLVVQAFGLDKPLSTFYTAHQRIILGLLTVIGFTFFKGLFQSFRAARAKARTQ